MIKIKNEEEINKIRKASEIVALCHKRVSEIIKPGISTKEIDEIVENIILENNATPSFKGYGGFPTATCTSPNEQVVHGFPTDEKLLEGDIISIDIGANYEGYHGDSAWTYPVGNISVDRQQLLDHTKEALFAGLDVIKPGIHLSDISNAIEKTANKYNLGIVKELAGHGVGEQLHEDPVILNYGQPNMGPILEPGMVLAIEPMLNLGTHRVKFHDDGWTVTTCDKKPSAHFEHTILVTKEGHEILTTLGGTN